MISHQRVTKKEADNTECRMEFNQAKLFDDMTKHYIKQLTLSNPNLTKQLGMILLILLEALEW